MIPMPFSRILLLAYLCNAAVSCLSESRSSATHANIKTLKFVSVISRHGSRSPIQTFPTDPYPYTDRKFWPNGAGELTNLGKVQLYHTGKSFRTRYEGFIDPLYSPNSTEVTYNPYNRDYMSSACLSAGMYPPVGPQIWDPILLWQPVVQDVRQFDVCDLAYNDMCPKFKQLFNEELNRFNGDSDKHKYLLEYMSKHSGMNYTQLSNTYDLYDTLLMQVQNGYKLSQWTKAIFPSKLRPLAVSYLVQVYAGSQELIALGAGPELKYVSDMMTMKANGTYNDIKRFYIEAAHDCTLLSLLGAFGNKDPNVEIQTGAYIVFELHYLPPNYIVEVSYYRTSYDEKPKIIDIPSCPKPCSLTDFNKFVDRINPQNYQESCKV